MQWRTFFRYPFMPMTLPESYTNLFSWEEQLRCLIGDVYKFIDYFNEEMDNLKDDIDLSVNAEIQNALAEIRQEVDSIRNSAQDVYNRLNSEMTALRRDMANNNITLRTEMSQLRLNLTNQFEDLDNRVNTQIRQVYQKIEDLKSYLLLQIGNSEIRSQQYTDDRVADERNERVMADKRLQVLIDNLQWRLPYIYNPARGMMGSIGQAVCDLYNYLGSGGLKINQIEDDVIPVNYFEDNDITVTYVDTMMGDVIEQSKALTIWSPYSGTKDRIDKVIYDMTKAVNVNNKRIDIFADNDIKVEDFDDSHYTAWEMGVHKWYNSSAVPTDYADRVRDNYVLLKAIKNTTDILPSEFVTKSYPYYLVEVLFKDTKVTKVFRVKSNARVVFDDYQLVSDLGVRDLPIHFYRYAEIHNIRNLAQWTFEDGYVQPGSTTPTATASIIISRIWGIESVTDILDKED